MALSQKLRLHYMYEFYSYLLEPFLIVMICIIILIIFNTTATIIVDAPPSSGGPSLPHHSLTLFAQ